MARRIRAFISDLLAYGTDLITIAAIEIIGHRKKECSSSHSSVSTFGYFMEAIAGAIITDICNAHLVCLIAHLSSSI